jgi:hypothetical protein
MNKLCQNPACTNDLPNVAVTYFIAWVIPALVLVVPFARSVGAEVTTALTLSNLHLSFLSILILGIWTISAVVTINQKNTSLLGVVLNALGFPGFFVGSLSLSQYVS